MEKLLVWFCNRSNITFVIAIAGFVMSLYNFFRGMWDRRCAFSVEYVNHRCSLEHIGHTQFVVRLNIRNLTSASLWIVRMFLVYGGSTYEFAFPAQQVWDFTTTRSKTVTKTREVLSQTMPFSLPGHGVCGAYFVAYLPEAFRQELTKPCSFEIVVQTRTKKKSFKVSADRPNADLAEYGYFPSTYQGR